MYETKNENENENEIICELCNGTDNVYWYTGIFIPCWECKNRRCNSVSNLNQNTHRRQ